MMNVKASVKGNEARTERGVGVSQRSVLVRDAITSCKRPVPKAAPRPLLEAAIDVNHALVPKPSETVPKPSEASGLQVPSKQYSH